MNGDIYAEQIIKMVKSKQSKSDIDYITHENNIEDGFVILNYEKICMERIPILDNKLTMVMPEGMQCVQNKECYKEQSEECKPQYCYRNNQFKIEMTFRIMDGLVEEFKEEQLKESFTSVFPKQSKIETAKIITRNEDLSYMVMAEYKRSFFVVFASFFEQYYMFGSFTCDYYDRIQWKRILKQMLKSIEIYSGV